MSNEEKSNPFNIQLQTMNVLDAVGSTGRWQLILFAITSFSGFFTSFHHLGSVFLAASPRHWCQIPIEADQDVLSFNNWTSERIRDYAIPVSSEGGGEYDKCSYYVRNYTSSYFETKPWSSSASIDGPLKTVSCDAWTYDHSEFESTVVTTWDLVCDKAPLRSLVQAIYMGGIFFGTFIYGYISDRYGRRTAILAATVQFITAPLLASLSVNYVWFIGARMLTGMGSGGIFSVTYVLMTEFTGPKFRDVLGIAYQMPFALGYMTLPAIAYFVRDWNKLQLTISLLGLLLVSYYWIIPESSRWLIVNGRFEEALPTLQRVAKINGKKEVDENTLTQLMNKCPKQQETDNSDVAKDRKMGLSIFADLFRTPQMRKRILVSYVTWASASMCYYGLSLKAPTLGYDRYLVAFLAGLIEIPSLTLGCVIIRFLPRKVNFSGTFLIGGSACLLIIVVPSSSPWSITALALTGKFFITISYSIVYLYTTEMFPTQNRNVALGTSSMCARIGATSAPFIVDLLGKNTPLIIFGLVSIIAGFLITLLPETRNRPLPETIDDVENSSQRNGNESRLTTFDTA